MDASEHPPFPATLRPTEKTRVAVLASLTMATLVFSVGFGNIFIRTVANHVNDKNCYVPTHSYTKNRHFVSTHVTITYAKLAIRNNLMDSLFCVPLIVPDSHFCVPLIVPDSLFCMPFIVPDSHFYVPH